MFIRMRGNTKPLTTGLGMSLEFPVGNKAVGEYVGWLDVRWYFL